VLRAGQPIYGHLDLLNTAPAGSFSEALDATLTGGASLAAAGEVLGIAGGTGAPLDYTLTPNGTGSFDAAATLDLVSDGTGIDTLGTTTLTPMAVTFTGTLVALASAVVLGGPTIDLGLVHVGAAQGAVTLENAAPAGTASEKLDAMLAGAGVGLATGGTVSLLAAGATSTALGVTLSETAGGTYASTATLDPLSDGSGLDAFGTTALPPQVITVKGTFSNYATAAFVNVAGPATLSGGGTAWTLDLGTLVQDAGAISDTLGIDNAAVGLADSLDGSFALGATGAFANGGFTAFGPVMAGGAGTVGTIGFDPTAAGTYAETVTLAPTSELAGGVTTLAAETLTVRAVVTPLDVAPVDFGDVRQGATVAQGLTVTNALPTTSHETLDLSIASANTPTITAAGSVTALAPGARDSGGLTVGLIGATPGVERGGAAVTYTIPGSSGGGSETVGVTGTVFAPATLDLLDGTTLDLGATHVGALLDGALRVGNAGAADGFTENLDASLGLPGSDITARGSIAGLAAGATGAFAISLAPDGPGVVTRTVTVRATSDGAGIDTLGTLGLPNQTIDVVGTFSNYATAAFVNLSYPGPIPPGGTTLDLGALEQGAVPFADTLGVRNTALGVADDLGGAFHISGDGAFSNQGFGAFSSDAAGGLMTVGTISLDTSQVGTFHETVTLTPTSDLGSSATILSAETLTVVGTVESPQTFGNPPCFAEGTRIATDAGPVPVEALREGDRVLTALGAVRTVKWIGHRRVECARHPKPESVWPVRIAAGAFGRRRPGRALWLSPDHAVFVDGVLIPVRYLINGATVAQVPVPRVTYFHVELERHDVLLAEGLPAESYLDTGNRAAFANGGDAVMAHPDFALRVWETQSCAPLVLTGPALAKAKARLLGRMAMLGHVLTQDADLHLLADGRRIDAARDGALHCFRLPHGVAAFRLVSRVAVPAQVMAESEDHRPLGVAVSRLVVDGRELPLDGPVLAEGWHVVEPDWRWTNGDALVQCSGMRRIERPSAAAARADGVGDAATDERAEAGGAGGCQTRSGRCGARGGAAGRGGDEGEPARRGGGHLPGRTGNAARLSASARPARLDPGASGRAGTGDRPAPPRRRRA
jgi:collagen type I/II/III/V/XI/XXIV/XXVII alpha